MEVRAAQYRSHRMLLAVSRVAILAASCVVPHPVRAHWRRAWISELRHYHTLLRGRGLNRRYLRARIWHHSNAAFRDAWRLFSETTGMRHVRSAIRSPGFCLGLIALALTAIVIASHGLAMTRAMLFPPYPDSQRLVLIAESGTVPGERHPVPPRLLDFWKTHNTTLAGLAGYQWNSRGIAWVTPEFFSVLGGRPGSLLLRRINYWKAADNRQDLAVVGRLKPGVSLAAAQKELRDLAARYRDYRWLSPARQAQVMSLMGRTRKPLYAYAVVCGVTALLLFAAAAIGMRADRRRIGRVRHRYWAYFCAKSATLPLALALSIWEFSRATSFTVTGGSTFVAEPVFIWLVILACGSIVWWCLADQRVRCRACLGVLQYPVRIGSLGAVLFDHAGMELMCREGHGSLYLPAVSSDYVQRGGWTAMDIDITETVPR
jgi:hypothetical protein